MSMFKLYWFCYSCQSFHICLHGEAFHYNRWDSKKCIYCKSSHTELREYSGSPVLVKH